MARSRTIPSTVYSVGNYGPFDLDGFTKNNTERLVLRLTRENWPTDSIVARGSFAWDDGTTATFTVSSHVRVDQLVNADWVTWIGVRRIGNAKSDILGATLSFEVLIPFRTSVSFTAE